MRVLVAQRRGSRAKGQGLVYSFVAAWIHFTLFGKILPTIKTERVPFLGLMNSATKTANPRNFGTWVGDDMCKYPLCPETPISLN